MKSNFVKSMHCYDKIVWSKWVKHFVRDHTDAMKVTPPCVSTYTCIHTRTHTHTHTHTQCIDKYALICHRYILRLVGYAIYAA